MAGLSDRSPRPQSAARKMLHAWLKDACDNDPVVLLKHIDASNNEGKRANLAELDCSYGL